MTAARVRASGVGSWPTVGSRDAVRMVRDLLIPDDSDDLGIPYLPEQPERGPGADMIGRSAGLLVEMGVDLQPSGWRLVTGSARDVRRSESYLGEDLDELAEAYEGYEGPLKVQVVGPWTLAANVWLPRGERVVSDPGAVRDVAQSLAAGTSDHLHRLQRLVPGAEIVLQVDEPSLPSVLRGDVRTASGYGTLRASDRGLVEDVLGGFVRTTGAVAPRLVAHCCAPEVPVEMLRRCGVDGLGLDLSLLGPAQYESVGEYVDAGLELWAGMIPTATDARHPREFVELLRSLWRRIGLGAAEYDRLVLTPACGLGRNSPQDAVRIQRLALEAAAMLGDEG